jgi:RNA polymerase-binding transcription factor DksA
MVDDMDRAQTLDGFDREVAMSNVQARIAAANTPRDVSVDGRCIECDLPIEPARLAALRGATSRCADCARQFEQRVRMTR